jgi:hypothetical protein
LRKYETKKDINQVDIKIVNRIRKHITNKNDIFR